MLLLWQKLVTFPPQSKTMSCPTLTRRLTLLQSTPMSNVLVDSKVSKKMIGKYNPFLDYTLVQNLCKEAKIVIH